MPCEQVCLDTVLYGAALYELTIYKTNEDITYVARRVSRDLAHFAVVTNKIARKLDPAPR